MPRVFFTCNNFKKDAKDKKDKNDTIYSKQIAYYHDASPKDHVTWKASVDLDGIGETLWLTCNKFGMQASSGTYNGRDISFERGYGHFSYPNDGEYVVVFQQVHGKPRVVTHVLRFEGVDVSVFARKFKHLPATIKAFREWAWLRKTTIVAVLRHEQFGGQSGYADLASKYQPKLIQAPGDHGAITLDTLTGGHGQVGNGRIFLDVKNHSEIDFNNLQSFLCNNDAYHSLPPDQW